MRLEQGATFRVARLFAAHVPLRAESINTHVITLSHASQIVETTMQREALTAKHAPKHLDLPEEAPTVSKLRRQV